MTKRYIIGIGSFLEAIAPFGKTLAWRWRKTNDHGILLAGRELKSWFHVLAGMDGFTICKWCHDAFLTVDLFRNAIRHSRQLASLICILVFCRQHVPLRVRFSVVRSIVVVVQVAFDDLFWESVSVRSTLMLSLNGSGARMSVFYLSRLSACSSY
jgi:hypothetical protein